MTNFPSRAAVLAAGAVSGAILMFAGAIVAEPTPVVTTSAATSTPTPTYQGRYDAILTPSVEVRPPAPAAPGPQKDDPTPIPPLPSITTETTAPSVTTEPPVTSTVVVPVPTTTRPPVSPVIPPPVPTPPPVPVVENEPVQPDTVTGACNGLGVAANVARACVQITREFPELKTIGGRAPRPGNPTSCHPRGLALDFMISDRALGDRVATYIRENRRSLDATPVILWQVPAHYDHVHVSFSPCRG